MQKLCYLSCFVLLVIAASCNSGKNKSRVKEPEAVVARSVSGDTVVTFYTSARPYKLDAMDLFIKEHSATAKQPSEEKL